MEEHHHSSMYFLCGINNSIGLKLAFYKEGEGRCIARFRPKQEHQGSPAYLHGGTISAILDVPTQFPVHSGLLAV